MKMEIIDRVEYIHYSIKLNGLILFITDADVQPNSPI